MRALARRIAAVPVLERQVREFFITRLVGVFRWDEALFDPLEENRDPTPAEAKEGKERSPGKFRESVTCRFGNYSLTIESPGETPPLGKVVLTCDGAEVVTGPLSDETWSRAEKFIKEQEKTNAFDR